METFLIKAAQLILAFAILVIIHEFGHFLFARVFGIRNEKFYLFFNPGLSLFKWKPKKYVSVLHKTKFLSEEGKAEYEADLKFNRAVKAKEEAEARLKEAKKSGDDQEIRAAQRRVDEAMATYKQESDQLFDRQRKEYDEERKESRWKRFWSHTVYGIGWLPLGGYCKIGGMIDESMDTEQLKRDPQPWEFRAKPAWQRLLVMIAGVLFNFLLAIIIYAGIVYTTGEKYVPFSEAKDGMEYSGEARKIGFHDGDIPLRADGVALDNPMDAHLKMAQAKSVTVLRNGKEVDIQIPEKFIFALENEAKSDTAMISFFNYRFPTRISQVAMGDGADKAGIRKGDVIIAVDSTSTPSLLSFINTLKGHEDQTVHLTVTRSKLADDLNSALRDTLMLPVKLDGGSKMGVGLEIDPAAFYKANEIHYSLLQSLPRGMKMGTDKLTAYAKSMKMVFTKEGAKSIGGFGTLGSIFPESWNWIAFWNIAAFLSVALAFMNILPIPALDGGHVLFLLYEVVTGRKPSEKFLEYAQMFGMVVLILLLLYANGMDILRLFK